MLELEEIDRERGPEEYAARQIRDWGAPSQPEDPHLVSWLAGYLRRAASPGAAIARERMNVGMDVRDVLPAVHVPTLVLSRAGDRDFLLTPPGKWPRPSPGPGWCSSPGPTTSSGWGTRTGLLDEIEEFLKELGDDEDELDRVLATVLFTDIVRSTERTAELGDRQWRQVLEEHNRRIRGLIGRFRGCEVDTAGDGFLATFDGPIRAARCARRPSRRSAPWTSRSGPACTPARWSKSATRCGGSRSTSEPGWPDWPARPRFWPRRR